MAADLDLFNQEKEETASNPPYSQDLESLPIDDPLERVEQFINAPKQDQNKDNNEIIEINTSTGSKSYNTVKQEIDSSVHESPMPIVKPKNAFSEPSAAELTKFLLRKDLTLSRLFSFSDKPESYREWKSSFNEVVKEIGVTPSKEIGLMIKRLGSESKEFALSISLCNTHDPSEAFKRFILRTPKR